MEMPKTQKEKIDQLWFTIIGSNGDGLAKLTRQNSEAIQRIDRALPLFQTKEGCAHNHENAGKRRVARRYRRSDLIIAIGMLIVALGTGIPAWLKLLGG